MYKAPSNSFSIHWEWFIALAVLVGVPFIAHPGIAIILSAMSWGVARGVFNYLRYGGRLLDVLRMTSDQRTLMFFGKNLCEATARNGVDYSKSFLGYLTIWPTVITFYVCVTILIWYFSPSLSSIYFDLFNSILGWTRDFIPIAERHSEILGLIGGEDRIKLIEHVYIVVFSATFVLACLSIFDCITHFRSYYNLYSSQISNFKRGLELFVSYILSGMLIGWLIHHFLLDPSSLNIPKGDFLVWDMSTAYYPLNIVYISFLVPVIFLALVPFYICFGAIVFISLIKITVKFPAISKIIEFWREK